jgi:hypothetical protein
MTLYLLKVHLQTFLSIPITQKFPILSCDTLVANERYALLGKCTACTFTVNGGNVFLWYLTYYTSYARGPQYKYTLLWKLKDHMSVSHV